MQHLKSAVTFALAVACLITAAQALAKPDILHQPNYDPTVPSFQSVLGYDYGTEISSHQKILTYMQALAQANPSRMRLVHYARSWEGRDLFYVIIGSPGNIARLDELEQGIQRLADPEGTSEEEISALIDQLPATAWLASGVHGDEISSSEAGLLTAYHLLASRDDELVQLILDNTLVFIDPLQNPDGRDRFVNHYTMNRGLIADDYASAAERIQSWPGGRGNHYFFDMNRDWFAVTQPETAGRVRILQQWYPLLHIDFHEMDLNSSYFFPPTAPPISPHYTASQVAGFELYGKNNAAWFDFYGIDYFTREIFDYFYPGYGDSWPGFYGAIGMTYEQASVRGLIAKRDDGSLLSYRESVQQHFIASLASLETTALNRVQLYRNFVEFRRSATAEGKKTKRYYILPLVGDTSSVHRLAGLLDAQGVRVQRAGAAFSACGEHPQGSYLVNLGQPAYRLIRSLLEPSVQMEQSFIREQERRRKSWVGHELYDVTAWSLPLMFNVAAIECNRRPAVGVENVTDFQVPGTVDNPQAKLAFVVPWGTTAAGRFLTSALRKDLHILSNDKPFTLQGRQFPAGSLILKLKQNPADLASAVTAIATVTGAEVIGTDTSWVEEGINFGSDNTRRIKPVRVGLLWNEPTSPYTAGEVRYVLERQFGYPVTVIPADHIRQADLGSIDTLILPTGSYDDSSLTDPLASWVNAGGTLIAIEDAVSAVSKANLLDTKREYLASAADDTDDAADQTDENTEDTRMTPGTILTSETDYEKAIAPRKREPDWVPGVLLRARKDKDHWLGSGLPESVNVLFRGNGIYTPMTLDKGVNVLSFDGPASLLASGYLWEENRAQIAYKPFVMIQSVGRGLVIGFTASPSTRAYQDGLNLLLLNAVFRGPSHLN